MPHKAWKFIALVVLSSPAGAAELVAPRKPLQSLETRESALDAHASRVFVEIIRERSPRTTQAVFHADPQAIDQSTVVLFVVYSEAASGIVQRWRCVAVGDVAECLGVPMRFTYLPSDERMVLRMVVRNIVTDEGRALLTERTAGVSLRGIASKR